MAPLQHTPWHLLPLTTPLRSVPPLLVQSTFTATSYTLYLTDLTSIWTETLSKREILARSEKEGTSIDPSEDLSQLKILLEKLQHAVLIPSEGVDAEITSTSDGTLRLKTITELQTPLRPLSWTFCLSLEPKVQYTNLFVLPLLGAVATLQDQTESLLQTIREKDMLIERLTDQLKEHSLDVKAMLGGGRTRRRGLEKFDEEAWRGDYVMEGERRVGEVVKEIFGGKGGMKEVGGGVRGLGMVEEWWRSVEDSGDDENKQGEVPMRKAVGRKVEEKTPVRDLKKAQTQTDDEGDEFKVQISPPRRSIHPSPKKAPSPTPTSAPLAPGGDHTASDSDGLDLPPPPRKFTPGGSIPRPASKTIFSPPKPKSVGKIGGKKAERLKNPSFPPRARTPDTDMADVSAGPGGEETEDSDTVVILRALDKGKGIVPVAGSDSDTSAISPPPKSRSRSGSNAISPLSKHRGSAKMVIGGKKKPSTSASPAPPLAVENTDSGEEVEKKEMAKPAPIKKVIGRIGKIGGKKIVKDKDDNDAEIDDTIVRSESPGPSSSTSTRSPPPPPPTKVRTPSPELEDEDEKADRKRRQLEKELEAKKKAPAKKKRKF